MNIDSIITEWTYRLEKGYPDSPEEPIKCNKKRGAVLSPGVMVKTQENRSHHCDERDE